MTREDKVNSFRKAGDQQNYLEDPAAFVLYNNNILEEAREFTEATRAYAIEPTADNRAKMVKEWADLQYVTSGAACFYEIDGDPAFNRVHLSNMSKVVEGKVTKREDGKILKPSTYFEPDMQGL